MSKTYDKINTDITCCENMTIQEKIDFVKASPGPVTFTKRFWKLWEQKWKGEDDVFKFHKSLMRQAMTYGLELGLALNENISNLDPDGSLEIFEFYPGLELLLKLSSEFPENLTSNQGE